MIAQFSMGKEEPEDSDDEDYFGHDVAPLAVPRRQRRMRQQDLGPVRPTRLRPRH